MNHRSYTATVKFCGIIVKMVKNNSNTVWNL